MKSPENKKKWIIDTEAAEIVRDIYIMCLDGMGNEAIAIELQNRQVLIPMAYWQSKGLNRVAVRKHSLTRISGVKPLFRRYWLNSNTVVMSSISRPIPKTSRTKPVSITRKSLLRLWHNIANSVHTKN